MQERNQQDNKLNNPSDMTNKGHGPQGIDKAPGEEPSQDIENVVYQTQKGKNKIDGDPTKESDQPIENE
jgi:hypothetical protein